MLYIQIYGGGDDGGGATEALNCYGTQRHRHARIHQFVYPFKMLAM